MSKFDWDVRRRAEWTVPGTDVTYTIVEMSGAEFQKLNSLDGNERVEQCIRGSLRDQGGELLLQSDEDAAEFFSKLGVVGFHSLVNTVTKLHSFDLGNSPASVAA